MRRIGSLRLEILLDLCEAAGHLTPEARDALARVTELDIREPDARAIDERDGRRSCANSMRSVNDDEDTTRHGYSA